MRPDDLERRTRRTAEIDRTRRVMLHPLTQVGVRVFVPVRISRSELMVDILSDGERSEGEQNKNQAQRESTKTQ